MPCGLRADDELDGGSLQLVLRWAKLAHWFDRRDPNALLVLGLAWSENHHHELALRHFESAFRIIEDQHPPLDAEFDVIVAVEAARACARLRLDARSEAGV